MRRRIINPGAFPPEDRPAGVIDEILEERVVSSRGPVKPRGVRQKMSGFPLRKRGPVSRQEHRWTLRLSRPLAFGLTWPFSRCCKVQSKRPIERRTGHSL